ncbi:hypothetical protein MCHI_003019 [Candidatus Magnetoovum chiemensis]|nr:hypothetical protein MCHI_003019 [Candidatus Magnetoovum chiemensis]
MRSTCCPFTVMSPLSLISTLPSGICIGPPCPTTLVPSFNARKPSLSIMNWPFLV